MCQRETFTAKNGNSGKSECRGRRRWCEQITGRPAWAPLCHPIFPHTQPFGPPPKSPTYPEAGTARLIQKESLQPPSNAPGQKVPLGHIGPPIPLPPFPHWQDGAPLESPLFPSAASNGRPSPRPRSTSAFAWRTLFCEATTAEHQKVGGNDGGVEAAQRRHRCERKGVHASGGWRSRRSSRGPPRRHHRRQGIDGRAGGRSGGPNRGERKLQGGTDTTPERTGAPRRVGHRRRGRCAPRPASARQASSLGEQSA